MNFLFFEKFQFIRLVFHKVYGSKYFKKLCFQLPVLLGFNIFTIQPSFIAKNIAFGLKTFVITLILKLLYMKKIIFADRYELSEIF